MKHDNLPKKNPIWLLFDIDNGDSGSKHYVWWFDSRKKAREHKQWHINNGKTELVGPVRATVDKIPQGAFQGTRLALPPVPKAAPKKKPKGTCYMQIDLVGQGTTRRCLKPKGHAGPCSPYA